MNFFTSSFNVKQIVFTVVATAVTLFMCANIALHAYIVLRTDKTHFSQSTSSKTKHMRLNISGRDMDVIFIGNSHTEFHVSTKTFSEHGMSVYNLGISGAGLSNYPYMAEEAIKQKPKHIVLSIQPTEFYDDSFDVKSDIRFLDLAAIIKAPFPLETKGNAIKSYLLSYNKIRTYAAPIYQKIKSLYERFNKNSVQEKNGKSLQPPSYLQDEKHEVSFDGCHVTEQNVFNDKTTYQCHNGDLIMDGQGVFEFPPRTKIYKEISSAKVTLISNIAKKAKADNIKFIVVLGPHPRTRAKIDQDLLEEQLGVKVISFGDLAFPDEMWGDIGHLNSKGRLHYSNILAQELSTHITF